MSNLTKLLGQIAGGEEADHPRRPSPSDEKVVSEALAYFENYNKPCRFQPGHLVRPRKSSSYRFKTPAIVLEVRDATNETTGIPFEHTETGGLRDCAQQSYGRRLDMRVLHYVHDEDPSEPDRSCYSAFWVESWEYEEYKPKDFAKN